MRKELMTMSSQRTFFRFIFSVVVLVLLLHISFSLISTSPVNAKETTPETGSDSELIQIIEELRAALDRMNNQDIHFLLLQIEDTALGGSVTMHNQVLTIAVDRRFFDSCSEGDDITDSPWVQNLTPPAVGETRIIVAGKFVNSR
jgi:hypothetical protein